ncbi:MAG: UDP-2,3-diacylglucosamine diphosphatase LpxI [Pseudomonadota bacterium]
MPAEAAQSRLKSIQTLGIVAGGGTLPGILASACEQQGVQPFIVGIDGQVNPETLKGRNHVVYRLGLAGKMIDSLKANNAYDLVLIGSVKRPKLFSLFPDMKTAGFFARLGLKAIGDNDMLVAVRKELEKDGFTIHGVHEFVQELLAPAGVLSKREPTEGEKSDIELGIQESQELGRQDIGQAVIVKNGDVIDREDASGTDAMIKRIAKLNQNGGVLVKTCKPQQDKNLDLPTIGPDTVQRCADAGIQGIVIHAGKSLVTNQDAVRTLADDLNIFVVGAEVA